MPKTLHLCSVCLHQWRGPWFALEYPCNPPPPQGGDRHVLGGGISKREEGTPRPLSFPTPCRSPGWGWGTVFPGVGNDKGGGWYKVPVAQFWT